MNNNMTNERLAQLIKSVEAASSNLSSKENSDFLDNFRQILNEANNDEFLQSNDGSPQNDYQDDEELLQSNGLSPRKISSSFLTQIQMEKDPVEVRAQLIQLVRRTPELYDKNDPRYKNNAHKGVLWSKIAREIGNGATGKKVREQWSYMRRKYEEEYHSRLAGNAPTPMDPSKRHLFTYDQLSFLEPYVSTNSGTLPLNARSESPRPPLSHQNSTSDEGVSGRVSRNDLGEDFGPTTVASNLNQLLLQLAQHRTLNADNESDARPTTKHISNFRASEVNGNLDSSKGDPSKLKRTASGLEILEAIKRKRLTMEGDEQKDPEAEIAALNASVLCLSRCLEEVLPKNEEDDCSIFGRQIANDLRQLSKRRRLTVRKQIADLLVQQLCENEESGEKDENKKAPNLDVFNNN